MALNQQQLAEGERQRAEQQSACQSLLGWFFVFVIITVVLGYFDHDKRNESDKKSAVVKVAKNNLNS